jgi:jumonji domain-containing protein 2
MTTSHYITAPVYTPTWEEFSDFTKFIESIEEEAAPFGVCKVIPPPGWRPNEKYLGKENEIDFPIQTAITQHTTGAKGVYLQMHEELPNLPIRFTKFKKMIMEPPKLDKELEEQSTPSQEFGFIERKYWKNILFQPAIYASDIPGSLFDAEICNAWNLQNLNTVLQKQFKKHDVCIPGVNSPFLYVGSYKSTFCWHTEDMELYSINYLHFGAPKTWYSVPLAHKKKFEDLSRSFFPDEFKKCPQVLRHKNILISPSVLSNNAVQVTKTTQQVGEFMITFPGGYHSGFNHGLNCAEATNFATKRWIDIGKQARRCTCESGTVNIDMAAVFGDVSDGPSSDQETISFDTYLGDFKIDFLRRKGKQVPSEQPPSEPEPRKKSTRKPKVQEEPTVSVEPIAVQPPPPSVLTTPEVTKPDVMDVQQDTPQDVPPVPTTSPKAKTPKKTAPKKTTPEKTAAPQKIEKPKIEKKKHHPLFAKFYSGTFKFAKFK